MFVYMKRYWYLLFIGGLLIIGIILINKEADIEFEGGEVEKIAAFSHTTDSNDTDDVDSPDDNESTDSAVDVKGAVLDPGVYQLEGSARIYDVIELAGGFTDEADVVQVNLAQRVHDEMLIYVPKIGEEEFSISSSMSSTVNQEDTVRINSATQEELETLNGIGPSKAQAILEYIEENGPLTELDDLLQISGIGKKTLEKFEDKITIP